MAWFRLYDEIIDDENLDELDVHEKWFWIVCLALANRSKVRGRLMRKDGKPLSIRTMAKKAGITVERAEEAIRQFEELGMIHLDPEDNVWVITNWDKRQYVSDSSKERVKAFRERLKALGLSPSGIAARRNEILQRDDGKCVYCGAQQNIIVSRFVAPQLGGDDDPLNLIVTCRRCASRYTNQLPGDVGMTVHRPETAQQYLENLKRLGLQGSPLQVEPLPEDDFFVEPITVGPESELPMEHSEAERLIMPSPEEQEFIAWIKTVLHNWTMSGPLFHELLDYGKRLSWPVLRRAVERTLANDKRSINYCLRICEEWDNAGVRNLADLERLDEGKKEKTPSPHRREVLPKKGQRQKLPGRRPTSDSNLERYIE